MRPPDVMTLPADLAQLLVDCEEVQPRFLGCTDS